MSESINNSKKAQIKSLLIVFGSGIAAAIALAIGMLYYYNPTGSYKVKNLLPDPDNLQALHYSEPDGRGKHKVGYVFKEIGFSYFDVETKNRKEALVDAEKYSEFFKAISDQEALSNTEQSFAGEFNDAQLSKLLLKVHPENTVGGSPKNLIEMDFARSDYYRIQLRASKGEQWAYFYLPGIYNQVNKLFVP